jgi:hypothetical protein
MSDECYGRRYKPVTKEIIREFRNYGTSSVELAEKYGLHWKTASKICSRSLAVTDIGDAPEHCRLGIYNKFKEIIEPILRKYGVRWPQIMGPSRVSRIVKCRWECFTALNDAGKPYIRIATFFGRDHTTVLNGCKKVREQSTPYKGALNGNRKKKDGSLPAAKRGQAGSGEGSRAA